MDTAKELLKHLASLTFQGERSISSTAESMSNHNADDANDEHHQIKENATAVFPRVLID